MSGVSEFLLYLLINLKQHIMAINIITSKSQRIPKLQRENLLAAMATVEHLRSNPGISGNDVKRFINTQKSCLRNRFWGNSKDVYHEKNYENIFLFLRNTGLVDVEITRSQHKYYANV